MAEALRLGAAVEAIEAAIELARAVRAAGDRHMDEFASRRMADASVAGV